MAQSVLLDDQAIQRTLTRIAHQIIEKNKGIEQLVLMGIKTRGIFLAHRINEKIQQIEGQSLPVEQLDITFYRDDKHRLRQQAEPEVQPVNFTTDLNDKIIILIDDVLYTGRTIRAAMDAILSHVRPSQIQLATLIDRGHRELPIRADYVGKNIPTSKQETIAVQLVEVDGVNNVIIN